MTKTLIEQWREGKLSDGYYYIKGAFDDDIYISHLDYEIEEDKRLPVEEVLAPVPSYEDVKQFADASKKVKELEKRLEVSEKEHYRTLEQLRIATAALKEYKRCENGIYARKALALIKEVK